MSYWLKEPKPDTFKGTEEEKDQIHELNKDPISTYNQQLVETAIGRLTSPFSDPKYNNDLYSWDQETNNNKEITKVNAFTGRVKTTTSRAQRIKILKVIKEIETKSAIKTKSVIGIKTLLDTITITLQHKKEEDIKS